MQWQTKGSKQLPTSTMSMTTGQLRVIAVIGLTNNTNCYISWRQKARKTTFGSVSLRVYIGMPPPSYVCYAWSLTMKTISSNLDHLHRKTSKKLIFHIIRTLDMVQRNAWDWSSTVTLRHLCWPRYSLVKRIFQDNLMDKYNQLWKTWTPIVCGSWSIKLTQRVKLYRRAYGCSYWA